FHDKIRQSVGCRAGVQKPCSIGMLKLGQDLPLDSKATQDFLRICASFENFDSNSLFKLPIGALGEINGSHPTSPEFLYNHVGAEPLPNAITLVSPETGSCELCEFFEDGGIVLE